jgi:ring-1,2-phenylacetyl-CoA epoxidase subunit PaaC
MSDNKDLVNYVLRLGDDALVLGQRLIEWTSKAPFLEEDLAMSNTALDFVGRARFLYGYAAKLSGGSVTEDTFAYQRDIRDFSNCLIYELPNGDFAFSYARQFMIDAYDVLFFEAMLSSKDEQLAAIAGKSVKESRYHLRHSSEWMRRLGDGTEESHQRLQAAINKVADFSGELFEVDAMLEKLIAQGIAVDPRSFQAQWQQTVDSVFGQATVGMTTVDGWHQTGGRSGVHTEHLGHLLAELQFMQRAYPGLEW